MPEPAATAPRPAPPAAAAADVQHEPLSGAQQAELQRLERSYVPFELRLERLRGRARRGAWTATWLSAICATLLLVLLLTVIGVTTVVWRDVGAAHMPSLPPLLRLVLTLEFALIPPLLLFALGRTVLQLCTAPRLFAHYYREALSYCTQRMEALYYGDMDFAQLLEEARQRHIGSIGFFQPRERQRSFERQLEYLACFGLPLRLAAQLRPLRGRVDYVWGMTIYRAQALFQIPLAAWLGLMCAGAVLPVWLGLNLWHISAAPYSHALPPHIYALTALTPLSLVLLMLPVGMGFQYAPRYIISRARLVALLDMLLDRPQVDPASLPAPVEPRGWWARQLAPWKCRERAPQ